MDPNSDILNKMKYENNISEAKTLRVKIKSMFQIRF